MTRTDHSAAAPQQVDGDTAFCVGRDLVITSSAGYLSQVPGEGDDLVLVLWRRLRDRVPHSPPTVLDRLLADVLSSQRIEPADIRARLETAAAAADEPEEWAATLADERQRELLSEVLQSLVLVESSSLGTASARQLRDLPDSDDVVRVMATVHPTSPAAASHPRQGLATTTLARSGMDDFGLSEDEIRLLAQIASGVTADVAAQNLELSARTLRRRLRDICDRLQVTTPIEAVVWAARRHLI